MKTLPYAQNQSKHPVLEEFMSRTGILLIHLLDNCNLSCRHCYLDASPRGSTMLPPDLVLETIAEAAELGIKSIQFSGGEPLLYPNIFNILKAAVKKGLDVKLSTNATLISDDDAKRLGDLNIYVVTSIDGPEAWHDDFRGRKGSFAATEKAISRLLKHNVEVQAVTTVCEDNFQNIEWCAQWACGLNLTRLQFQPLESIGRGVEIEEKRLVNEQLNDLFIKLNDLAALYLAKGLRISMTYESRDFMMAHPCKAYVCNGKNCHRKVEKELKKIIIREDGDILPELVNINRKYAVGNLFDDTLKNNLQTFLKTGWVDFDRLCRKTYENILLNYPSPLIPWNEILTHQSHKIRPTVLSKTKPHDFAGWSALSL